MADDMIEKNKLNNQLNIFKKLDDDCDCIRTINNYK